MKKIAPQNTISVFFARFGHRTSRRILSIASKSFLDSLSQRHKFQFLLVGISDLISIGNVQHF